MPLYRVLSQKFTKLEMITQSRPIGSCNTLYYTITKILARTLKPFLDPLVHPLQASLVLGRKVGKLVAMSSFFRRLSSQGLLKRASKVF